ncbi:MAG: cytochrome [Herbinix sp.]|jgi:fatty-acid peroxygenase|nr:cytochrome [Herbinix sp.]
MKPTRHIPSDKCLDNTLKLLLEGYLFIPNRTKKYNSNIFRTRVMGQNAICMSGEDAAKIFYNKYRFRRKGATPKRIQKTLFGENGIQSMDGRAHRHRKQMFMSLMTPDRLDQLVTLVKQQWFMNAQVFAKKDYAVLFDEAQLLLCQAACKWAGVPLGKQEAASRAMDFGKMVDAFGAVGPRYWQGKCARRRAECWIKEIIIKARIKSIPVRKNCALYDITWHRDLKGNLLEPQIAAVELINVLRPIVAIATYITFSALAIHDYPHYRKSLQREDNFTHMFVQEVRRFYPFGPFVGAKVRKNFTWKQCRFKKGTLVLFDLYGTNHDPKLWKKPYQFRPERFTYWDGNPFDFVPQGGGNYYEGHRCPGEWVTIEIMKTSINFLANSLLYEVPPQNLSYCLSRMPTLPKSRFVISKIKVKHA